MYSLGFFFDILLRLSYRSLGALKGLRKGISMTSCIYKAFDTFVRGDYSFHKKRKEKKKWRGTCRQRAYSIYTLYTYICISTTTTITSYYYIQFP